MPAGMELFAAGDESQMDVIKQWIDESDVYLLILAGRYGSIEPKSGKSYIHLEYDYALSKRKPLFACVIKETAIEAHQVRKYGTAATEKDNQVKLKEFRDEIVLSRMSEFWEDTKDIKITITRKLSQLARRNDLNGWVRASTQSNLPALADEIARLSKENAELRERVSSESREALYTGLTFSQMKAVLEQNDLLDWLVDNRMRLSSVGIGETDQSFKLLAAADFSQRNRRVGMFYLTPVLSS